MKANASYFFLLLAVVAGITAITPSVYAAEFEVMNAPGSSVPGCEETNECFLPYEIKIGVGDTVTWLNDDTAAHTSTSGSPQDGPDGIFDSSLIIAGSSFSHTFDTEGEYPYFCMVHPWMSGIVIVGEAMAEEGELVVSINTEPAGEGEMMTIDVEFMSGGAVEHVNYNVMATQNGQVILDERGVHDHDGKMSHTTMALPAAASDASPVNVEVEFLGFGIDQPFTGPVGYMETAQVVPEFGIIAVMILAVGVVSIIILTARTKVIPRL